MDALISRCFTIIKQQQQQQKQDTKTTKQQHRTFEFDTQQRQVCSEKI